VLDASIIVPRTRKDLVLSAMKGTGAISPNDQDFFRKTLGVVAADGQQNLVRVPAMYFCWSV
jgi:hypothetical protein